MLTESLNSVVDLVSELAVARANEGNRKSMGRGTIDLGKGYQISVTDVPSGRRVGGTDTVVQTTTPDSVHEQRVPTGGFLNRVLHGRVRTGDLTGPWYRFQAEQDVRALVVQTKEAIESIQPKRRLLRR